MVFPNYKPWKQKSSNLGEKTKGFYDKKIKVKKEEERRILV